MTDAAGPPVSPRLAELSRDVERGNGTAIDAFWRQIAVEGAPLVEPLAENGDMVLLTFLWREDRARANVLLLCGLAENGQDEMQRLGQTDLWYRSYRVRADLRTVYSFVPDHPRIDWLAMTVEAASAAVAAQAVVARRDELNPRIFDYQMPPTAGVPSTASVVELPGAPPQPWVAPRNGIARGAVKSHRFDSAATGSAHAVWTYTPPGYSADADPYGMMIVFDGYAYTRTINTPTILDNLLSERRVGPMVVAFVQGGDRLSELLCNPAHARFVADELVPWMRENFNVTSAPERTIVAGASAGGLAASFMALTRPDVFGNVLSQSGSYWWHPDVGKAHEWLTDQFAEAAPRAVRFYVDVGVLESGPTFGGGPSQVVVNRRFRDVLRARGHDVTYNEFPGAHDYICWRGTLADGLIALARR